MRERILCMYSGGVDSTGMLYEILSDMKYLSYDIHVHHISMINLENRHEAELQAVMKCLSWLQKKFNRKLLFTKNIMDFNFLQPIFPVDSDIYAFVAGQIFRSCNPGVGMKVQYKYMATGTTKLDIEVAKVKQIELFAKNDTLRQKEIIRYEDVDISQAASPRTKAIIEASVSEMYVFSNRIGIPKIPKRIYPVLHMTKKEIMNKLPNELLDMTWTCRVPVKKKNNKYEECGKCKSCIEKHSY